MNNLDQKPLDEEKNELRSPVEGGGMWRSRPGDESSSRAKGKTYAFIQLKGKSVYLVSHGRNPWPTQALLDSVGGGVAGAGR